MVDTVTSQTIVDGSKVSVLKFTNVSDGTGEASVVKVDVSALEAGATSRPKIRKCWYATAGMAVSIFFDGSTNALALSLGSDSSGHLDFSTIGGISNDAASATGDILFSTIGATSGDAYTVILEVVHTV